MMRGTVCGLLLLATSLATLASAQSAPKPSHEVDLAVAYDAERRGQLGGGSFWEQGGSGELSATVFRGLGAAATVSGGHASNISGTGVSLSSITATAGPRYTFARPRYAVFVQGGVGESSVFDTVFPVSGGTTSANSFAAQAGGGLDLRFSRWFAVRAFQASWLRTEFPNAANNVQNSLQLGAGIVLRLSR